MTSWRDRINQFSGRTRYVVCRLFLHLAGNEVAPLLGALNQAAFMADEAEGDMQVLGEELEKICQNLLQSDTYWRSAANEGDVFWDEGEAGNFVNELFTDSAQRYLSQPDLSSTSGQKNDPLVVPITQNIIVMLTVAYEGEVPELESDLSNVEALKEGLKALINLHYQNALRAVQIHFSPAQLGDELTPDQILVNFPELIPL
ncbi:DUF1517 domain-containing protein [Altericista sp. CCNU0014]|uniref:DUF1517 domain-containing protein n=1 Tax=Altericista sp. CCNU0014 TaxID=3082949 RepID=UPI00384F1659